MALSTLGRGLPLTGGDTNYTEGQQAWLEKNNKEAQEKFEFFQKLSTFPNFFSLMPFVEDIEVDHMEYLMSHQENELKVGNFQFDLERIRCRNTIIFFKYLRGCKKEAIKLCESLHETMGSKSIIFLTLMAALQWEFGYQQSKCEQTMQVLEEIQKHPDYMSLSAAAESEKGYLLACIGPKGFIYAMDCFQKAIDCCQESDVFLLKYDLALAVRRNFNLHAYSEHPQLSAKALAVKALKLLQDVAANCPNKVYQARGLVELARLIQHLYSFAQVCENEERAEIEMLYEYERLDDSACINRAFLMDQSKEDPFVLRECGRHFLHYSDFQTAVWCLWESAKKREESIVYQQLAKAYLWMYTKKVPFFEPSTACPEIDAIRESTTDIECEKDMHPSTNRTFMKSHQEVADSYKMTQKCGYTAQHKIPSLQKLLRQHVNPHQLDSRDPRVMKAKEFFLRSEELNPRNKSLLYDLAFFCEQTGELNEAVERYETIIWGRKWSGSNLLVVNSFERRGLIFLKLGEECSSPKERDNFTAQAEDMFMRSLVECEQAVAHLPKVYANRAHLWMSYTSVLEILHKSQLSAGTLKKEAVVHGLVGRYIEALAVYQKLKELAGPSKTMQTEALLGCVETYLRINKIYDAKFIFDVLLISQERNNILTNNGRAMDDFRKNGVETYSRAACMDLENGRIPDARDAFSCALLLAKKRLDVPHRELSNDCCFYYGDHQAETTSPLEKRSECFAMCIFCDPDDKTAADVSEVLGKTCRSLFGLRVSVNDEGVQPGRLQLTSELELANSAYLVLLVIPPGKELSTRMSFVIDVALNSENKKRGQIMVMLVGSSDRSLGLPVSVSALPHFQGRGEDFMVLGDGRFKEHGETCSNLFNFILGQTYTA